MSGLIRSSRRMSPALTAACTAASLALAGCYVLPVDPRTGGPMLPVQSASRQPDTAHPAPVPVVVAAPPQNVVLQARLYPLNEHANRTGMLAAQVSDSQGGRGTFALHYNGQPMQGEATRVDAGFAGFGRIHDEVLGRATRSYAGRRGIANAYGPQGINAQCEYLITGPAMGTGVCLFSDGAKYQMHF